MKYDSGKLGLWSKGDQSPIPLQQTHIQAVLRDLLSEVCITQTFINQEKKNIEAVYTFPLPVDAVLLNFSVTLNEKLLVGVIQERKQAEEGYEEAIDNGNTAILLQLLEPGLYTVNVGNLAAEETAIIEFSFTQIHQWTDESLRWYLPTVIAPRYGNSSIEPHQQPEVDITVENMFSLSIDIHGILKDAKIESPSHAISQKVKSNLVHIELSNSNGFLDKDVILTFRLESDKASAICDKDFDGYAALASFCPSGIKSTLTKDKSTKVIKILVDCSGSMSGDSIGQARIALLNIMDTLQENDEFILIRFGSSVDREIPKPLHANSKNIKYARNIIAKMEADLGGTEIFDALEKTLDLAKQYETADLLLITDGEAWDSNDEQSGAQSIIKLANKTQQRIFTVGVGSSVAERLVSELAKGTKGACELVNPGEGMAEKN